uniref:Uncharacterized protein n=1 Tax=Pyxicephalus adspersus TaxID=30357 RepID=A0AAV2ZG49_PYXAD|nr:TPA: hypothetical protein GDO54_005243 [Pyxicephalus adspersus]
MQGRNAAISRAGMLPYLWVMRWQRGRHATGPASHGTIPYNVVSGLLVTPCHISLNNNKPGKFCDNVRGTTRNGTTIGESVVHWYSGDRGRKRRIS